MGRKSRWRPTPSMTVAIAALLIALASPAWAGPVAQLAKSINGKSIKKKSIPGNRLKNDTVTGKQVKESSLGTVPKAAAADSATNATNATLAADATTLGGLSLRKFHYSSEADATDAPILTVGTVSLLGQCSSNNPGLKLAHTTDAASTITRINSGTVTQVGDANLAAATPFTIFAPDNFGTADATIVTADGQVYQLHAAFRSSAFNPVQHCNINGYITAG